eukprot:scaffold306671_cov32-Tisochrysis_lutea.AAC.6
MREGELGVEVLREGALHLDLHPVPAAVPRRDRGHTDRHAALRRVPSAHRVGGGDVVVLACLEGDVEDEAPLAGGHVPRRVRPAEQAEEWDDP